MLWPPKATSEVLQIILCVLCSNPALIERRRLIRGASPQSVLAFQLPKTQPHPHLSPSNISRRTQISGPSVAQTTRFQSDSLQRPLTASAGTQPMQADAIGDRVKASQPLLSPSGAIRRETRRNFKCYQAK